MTKQADNVYSLLETYVKQAATSRRDSLGDVERDAIRTSMLEACEAVTQALLQQTFPDKALKTVSRVLKETLPMFEGDKVKEGYAKVAAVNTLAMHYSPAYLREDWSPENEAEVVGALNGARSNANVYLAVTDGSKQVSDFLNVLDQVAPEPAKSRRRSSVSTGLSYLS